MTGQIDYSQLEEGYEFPPASIRLEKAEVARYIRAVEETDTLYRDSSLVPPMAVAAHAMAALSKGISLPPGAIHVSQELNFLDTVNTGDTIISRSKVSRNQNRGKFHMLTVDLNVYKQDNKPILNGRTSFILPQAGEGQ